jgi:hypothetical protein
MLMITSESIDQMATALAHAQGEMENAGKSAANPFFKSKYADLASVWDACRGPLTKYEIAVVQSPSAAGAVVSLETLLVHRSGQWLRGTITVTAKDDSPQSVGSAITYLRRYALQSFVGVAPADDDAEAAQGRPRAIEPTPIQHPEGYLPWLDTLRATAQLGTPALERAWQDSPNGYRQHLISVGGDLWATIKAIAARKVA